MNAISPEDFYRDFQLVNYIGSGNCGSVSRIRKKKDGRLYARKKITTFSDKQHTAALSEVVNCCLIKDPGVVKIQYYFTKTNYLQNSKTVENYQFNVIMELCQMSLGQLIKCINDKRREHFSREQIWMFLKTMSRVFAKMQRENMLHRDIKPDNILVNLENGQVKQFKVTDFGYSVIKGDYHQNSIAGTEEYASPKIYPKFVDESINISGGVNEKDDMYSLGKTFLEMIVLKKTNNKNINENLFKYMQSALCKEYLPILRKMLDSDENKRLDFIQLEKEIIDIQDRKNNAINFANLQTQQSNHFNDQEGISANEKQKIYLRTKHLNFSGHEIYCMKIFKQLALLGSDSRLMVIPMKSVIKREISYNVRLKGIQDVKPIFRIKDIFVNHKHLVLFLDSNQFIHINIQQLYQQISYVIENHEELLKKQKIKQTFQLYGKKNDQVKIYDVEFQELTATLKNQQLTCVYLLDHNFCGVPNDALRGFLKGQITIYEGQESKTIHATGQRIDKLKAIDENRLIYTSCDEIHILEFTRIDSEIRIRLDGCYQSNFGSEIIYLRTFKQQKLDSQENSGLIFIEVMTRNGNYFRLDEKLQVTNFVKGKQTLRYVTQTDFNWSIKKIDKQEDDPNQIVDKKWQLNYENNFSLCYLTSSGLLKYVHSDHQISSFLFSRAKVFHVDSQIIIVCHQRGQIEILYTSNEPKPPKNNKLSKDLSKTNFPTLQQYRKNPKKYIDLYYKKKESQKKEKMIQKKN